MADVRSVTITLKVDNSQQNTQTSSVNTQKQTTSNANSSSTMGDAVLIATTLALQAAKVAVGEVVGWAEYYTNRELSLTDDYIGQRNKRVATTYINRATSALGTVASSALFGAEVGGPWGALAGAIIGTVIATANIVHSNVQGQDQENIRVRQMNAQLNYTRQRAGWSLQAASIGEDL